MRQSLLRLASVKRLVQRPWQCLLLLLLGLPLAWSAGVSINNMVITSVKQLAFAQSRAEVMVGAQFTQTATVRLSPGAVSYRSSNPQVATVNAQTGQVSGLLSGEATIWADQAAAPPYPAASASYIIKVKGQPVVFQRWELDAVAYGTAPFAIVPPTSNNLDGKIVYRLKDSNSPVASITEAGQITVKAVGSTTIVATQQPSGTFDSGSTEAVLQVTAASYALIWPDQVVQLGKQLPLQPPSSPNTQGAFSYTVNPDAQNRTIAKVEIINGKAVLIPIATGNTTLTVKQAASDNYGPATLDVKLAVQAGTFTITGFTLARRSFDAVDPNNNRFELTDPAKPQGSQAVYTYSVKDPADGTVTLSGRTVTINKPGTPTIVAHLSSDPAVHEEAFADALLVVDKATPTIGLAQVDASVGESPLKINVTSNSNAPITLALQNPQPAGFATLSQNANKEWIATFNQVGKATLVASQEPGSSGVFKAGSASVAFSVTAAPLQANTLTLLPFDKLTTDAPFTPPWSKVVGDASTIRVTSSNLSVATVSGQTITLTGAAGQSDITLEQDATATHTSAKLTALLTVRAKTAQSSTLYFTPNTIPKTFGDGPFTPDVFSSAGLVPKFSVAAADAGVAQVDGTGRLISILGAGTATITAEVSSADFSTTTATATLEVAKRDPQLKLLGSLQRNLRDGAFDLTLSTLSSGALSISSGVATATVTGSPPGSALSVQVQPLNAGTDTLRIHQEADANHKAADLAPVLAIAAQPASISWPLPKEILFTGAGMKVTLPQATSSNTATAIAYALSPTPNASLSGMDLSLSAIGTGSVTLTASQPATNGFAATQMAVTVPVVSAPSGGLATTQLVVAPTFSTSVGSKFQIPYTTSSEAPVKFTVVEGLGTLVAVDSSDASGHTLIGQGAGTATVIISQDATATHSSATQLVKVTVTNSNPITGWPEIKVTYDYAKSVIDIPAPLSKSQGPFTYSVDPAGAHIAEVVKEVNASRLHLLGAGTTMLYAQQAADGANPSDNTSTRLIVHAQANSLSFDTKDLDLDTQGRVVRSPSQSPTFWVKASSSTPSQGTIGYSSSNDSVASIDPNTGLVTVKGLPGETTFTASQAAWLGIAGAQVQLRVKVEQADTRLSLSPFELPVGATGAPPYQTSDLERAVQVSVSDNSYASVGNDGRSLTALREGKVTVTVTHPATATQASVSASAPMTITAKRPNLSVVPNNIQHVWTGAETTITLVPSSDNNPGAYTLTSSNPALAAVNGLAVTLRQPPDGQTSSTRLWLTQSAGNGWGATTVEIPVQVIVQAPVVELSDMSRRYGEPNFDLPATVNGQAINSYTSNTPATATIVGARTVQMNAVGSTLLEARNAAGTLVKVVKLDVTPGDPVLALAGLPLTSTTIEAQLQASRKGEGAITYSLLSGSAAEVRPDGLLLVGSPGTVTVQASVAAWGNYAAATTTAQVSIANGPPGLLLTRWPTSKLKPGEEFEVRYRTNIRGTGSVNAGLFTEGLDLFGGWSLVAHTLPAALGQEGVFRFKLEDTMSFSKFLFTIQSLFGPGFRPHPNPLNDPQWTRHFEVDLPTRAPITNLGPEIVLTYNPDHPITLPKTYDAAGNVVTDPNLTCGDDFSLFASSNHGVLAVGQHPGTHQDNGWYMVGVGQAWLSCSPNSPNVPRPVLVTVLPASPELQGFDDIALKVNSPAYTLTAPSTLNKTGAWTYTIVNDDPSKPVATIVNNNQVEPTRTAAGTATIIASQAASGFYAGGRITAKLTVGEVPVQSFGLMFATYSDPPFPVPRPAGFDGVNLTYRSSDTSVAEIVNGNIEIRKAQLSGITIEALQGNTVVATGRLVVDKAQTRLVFRMPTQAFWVDYCHGNNSTLPIANQGEGSGLIRGTLETNQLEGTLSYGGPGPASTAFYMNLKPPIPVPYYWIRVYAPHADLRPYSVWAEQAESTNYYGARTEPLTYFANSTPQQCPM